MQLSDKWVAVSAAGVLQNILKTCSGRKIQFSYTPPGRTKPDRI